MNIVLDTNILVAAGFNPNSSAARLVALIKSGNIRLTWNAATRAESQAVIRKIPPLSWDRFEPMFAPNTEFTDPTDPEQFGIVEDPADRKFIALAAATDAILVTNDDHLLSVRDGIDVTILTPGELVKRID